MAAVDELQPDMLGMIFYAPSPRYVQHLQPPKTKAQKVGVFVNEDPQRIIETAEEYDLSYIQLHGDEDVETVKHLVKHGLKIIKVFLITDDMQTAQLEPYAPYCSYFLFDTKGAAPGGNGIKFNWNILKRYTLSVPFLLSGGISLNDIETLLQIKHPALAGVDVNSRFEVEPGVKNIELLKQFIHAFRDK